MSQVYSEFVRVWQCQFWPVLMANASFWGIAIVTHSELGWGYQWFFFLYISDSHDGWVYQMSMIKLNFGIGPTNALFALLGALLHPLSFFSYRCVQRRQLITWSEFEPNWTKYVQVVTLLCLSACYRPMEITVCITIIHAYVSGKRGSQLNES